MTDHPERGALRPRLDAIMDGRRDWYRKILADIAERLAATALEFALKAGDAMPAFVLPSAEGRLVSSAALLARGPLVVCHVRGGWCPFCRETLSALEEIAGEISAAGASLVAVTPDGAGHALAAKDALGLSFEVLSDIDCAVGLELGIVYRVPDVYREALGRFGIDLVERHGPGPGLLPMPAAFIVGTDGRVRFAHVSGDVADRADPALLAGLVAQLADHA